MPEITVNIKPLSGGAFQVHVDDGGRVTDLQNKIEEHNDVPGIRQRLVFRGRELNPSVLLSECHIIEGCTVHLVIRPAGQEIPSAPAAGTYDTSHRGSGSHHDVENQYRNYAETQSLLNPNNNNNVHPQQNRGSILVFDPDLQNVGQSIRLIQLFSLIDCLLLLLFAFWGDFIFLAVLPLAACGFIGAKKLHRGALIGYAIFIIVSVAFRVLLCYFYPTWLMIVLTIISVILEFYILRKTIQLFMVIPHLTDDHRTQLEYYTSGII